MNKIYKVIWNRVRHCYVVVSEIAKNHGKEHSTNLCVSKRLVALTLAIGLSLSSYAFVMAADSVTIGHGGSASYDSHGNLVVGNEGTVAEGTKQAGEHNTTIGTDSDTLRKVADGGGQPMDTDDHKTLVDKEGQAHDLNEYKSTEAGGSTAVGYDNHNEGDRSTAIGNHAIIANKPVTYYVDADGNKTASADNAAWYKDASGNPTKVPQVFRDAGGKTTTTPQYVHTYTEKDPTTGENVTKTEITSDATKADQKDGQPVYNYQKTDNTPYLYTVTLYQAASNSIAAGTHVTAKGSNAVAVGYNSSADNSAVAIGDTAVAKENAVAMGKDTKATAEGSIALGKGSEASRDGGVAGWDPKTGTVSTKSDVAWKSGEGALSIGNGGSSRQITNVAAGSEDSDAVNLAQLKEAMTHYYSVKTTADTDAAGKNNYLNDGATGNNALAAGVGATASSDDATAVGTYANATASQATAIGRSASASSYQDTAIGYNAGAHGTYATAVGSSASATSFQSTAIGYNAGAHGSYAIAMGNGASATDTNAIAIGASANAPYENSTAVGASAKATSNQATAIGSSAGATATYATALGNGASATSHESTAIGSGAGAHGDYAIAMGNGASATNTYAVAIGADANAPSYQATALGNGASATSSQATAIGTGAGARGSYATALGNGASAYSSYATALGSGATAQSSDDTAIGSSAKASNGDATALGYNAQATAPNATALGSGASAYYHAIAIGAASASSSYALAAGDGANAQEYQAIALGYNAKSNVTGGVALGSSSTANVESGKTGLDPHTGAASTNTGTTWVSTLGAVSVGTVDSDGNATGTRQINGLAAGTKDTDAVNVAQLKAMETRINMHYYSVNSTLSGDGSNYDNTGASGTNALAAGPMASASGENAVAIGYGAKAEGRSATVIGKNASATGQYAMAFGGLDTTDKKGNPVTMTNTASGASATAFGQGAQAKGAASLAFGHNTVAGVDGGSGQQSVAFGEDTQALGGRSLAFGEKTIAKYNDSVAFGNDTRASSTGATAFGNRTRALSSYSTAWGNATVAADEESTAWGTDTIAGAKLDANGAVTNIYTYKNNPDDKNEQAKTATEQMDVHGNLAYIRADGTTAGIKQMPIDSGNEKHDYVVLAGKDGKTYVRDYQGSLWKVNVAADGTVTVDTTAGKDKNGKVYNGKNGAKQSLATTTVNGAEVAITPDNVLTKAHEGSNGYTIEGYANATAFGYSTEASGDNATAFGNDTKAAGAGATAFGYKTLASGENATAFGESSIAAGKNSLAALGGTTTDAATNAAAIGNGAKATLADSVALGSGAVADRASGAKGYDMLTKGDTTNTSTAWVSNANAIAVGNGSTLTRQITGVAAGSQDTDAVNVAQLKAAGFKVTTQNNGNISSSILNGDTLDFEAKDNAIVSTSKDSKTITVAVSKTPTFDSATFGTTNNEKVTIANGQVSAYNDQQQKRAVVGVDNQGNGTLFLVNDDLSQAHLYTQSSKETGNDGITRMYYTSSTDNGGEVNGVHTIAVLDDGINYAGDNVKPNTSEKVVVKHKLNSTMDITGGADTNNLSNNNIGVVATPAEEDAQGNITQKGKLEIKLNKDVTGLNTVTAGTAKIGHTDAGKLKTTQNGAETGKYADAGDYVTGLTNTKWDTKNPEYVSGRAATEDELATVSGDVTTNANNITTNANNIQKNANTIAKGLSFTTNTKDANNKAGDYQGQKVVNRKLGDTISIKANDADTSRHYATTNLTTEIADNGDITIKMDESPTFTEVTASSFNLSPKDNTTKDKKGNTASAQLNAHYRDGSLNPAKNVTMADGSTGMVRLHYHDGEGAIHDLATMDDGQIYAGDIKTDGSLDTTGFGRKMNEKTTINGGVTDKANLSDNNIGVVSKGTDTLTVKLAKNLKDLQSVQAGKTTIDDKGLTIKKSDDDSSKNVIVLGNQVAFGDNQVNNMGSGASKITKDDKGNETYEYNILNNGANIGDVKNIASSTVQPVIDTVNKGWELDVNGTKQKAVTPDSPKVNLIQGQNITIAGDTANTDNVTISTADDVRFNTVRVGGVKSGDTYSGGILIGTQSGKNADGTESANSNDDYYITGLKNTNWDSNKIQSGRAATEDQLQAVATEIKNGTVKGDVFVTGGAVSYNGEGTDTNPKDGKGSINLTRQNGKDVHIDGLHDYYVTGGTVTNDGKTLELTRNDKDASGNPQKISVDLGNVLSNDQHLVANPAAGSGGKYTVDTTTGTVTLKVQNPNSADGSGYSDITIGGFKGLGQGLKFGANKMAKDGGGNPVTNKLGSTINITGDGSKTLDQYSGKNLLTSVEQDDQGNTIVHVLMDKNISADGVTVGQAGKDGVAGADGEVGQAGTIGINGKNGKEGITTTIIRTEKGQPGENGTTGKPGVDGKDITRIVYQNDQDKVDGKDGSHTVATLDDGLKFSGDDNTVIQKKLNEQLQFAGGADKTKLTQNNIGINEKDGKLLIQLVENPNLGQNGNLTAGTAQIGHFDGNTLSMTKNGKDASGNYAKAGSYATGLSNKEWSVSDPEYVSGRAATEDQLKVVSDAIRNRQQVNTDYQLVKNPNKEDGSYTANNGELTLTVRDTEHTNDPKYPDKTITIKDIASKKKVDEAFDRTVKYDLKDDGTVDKTHVTFEAKDATGNPVDTQVSHMASGASEIQDDGNGHKTYVYNTDNNAANIGDVKNIANSLDAEVTKKGLNFKGNDGQEVHRDLGTPLNIVGGINDQKALDKKTGTTSSKNLGVRKSDDNSLEIVMTDTPDFTKVTVGEGNDTTKKIIIGKQTVTGTKSDGSTADKSQTGNYITGLDNKAWDKDNVVENRAATEGQLRDAINSVNGSVDKGFGLADEAGKAVTKKLGDTITVKGETVYNTNGTVAKEGNIKTTVKDNAIQISLNDQISIGQKGEQGEQGQPGTPGKDGKFTVETSKGTTVVIGHDGEPGEDGKDGLFVTGQDGKDGKSGVSITGPQGASGTDGIDGKVGIAGKDGKDAVSISGHNGEGHIGLTGPKGADGTPGKDGISIDITTDLKAPTLDSTKNVSTTVKDASGKETTIEQAPRIQYKSGDNTYEVATMDDGLKIGANAAAQGETADSVNNKLNSTINIKGSDAKADHTYTDDNLTTTVEQDADGNTTVKVLMDKDITGNSVTVGEKGESGTPGKDGVDGTIGVNGKDGSGVVIKGKDGISINGKDGLNGVTIKGVDRKDGTEGHIGLVGPKGPKGADGKDGQNASADIHVVNGHVGVDGTDGNKGKDGMDRVVYEDHNGVTHEVATMGDGLKFAGDDMSKTVDKKLNETLQIRGDGTYDKNNDTVAEDGNIKTSVDNGAVKVSLSDKINLHQDGSLTVGGDKKDGSTTVDDPIVIKHFDDKTLDVIGVDKDGKPTTSKEGKAGDYVTGLDNKDWNVSSPTYVSGRAATEDQLKKVSDAVNSAAATAGKHTVVTVNDKDSNETKAEAGTGAFGNYAGADKGNLLIAAKNDDGQMTYNIKLNDQLAIGQKGEPGVAGKDGKNGKVTVETKGGTTVVIGHDGQDGKDGKDGISVIGKDGQNGVSIIGSNGLNGKDGIDGKISIGTPGKDSQPGKDAVSISGQNGEGHIGLTGPKGEPGADGTPGKDGISIDITTDLKTATLDDGKNVKTVIKDKEGKETTIDQAPRIQYKSGDNTYEVATMDDGLKFVGDDGTATPVTKKLNDTLQIRGDGTYDVTTHKTNDDGNIKISSDAANGTIKVALNDKINLHQEGSLTVGGDKNGDAADGNDPILIKHFDAGDLTVTGTGKDGKMPQSAAGDYVTGLDNKNWDVDHPTYVSGRAATEDQLKKVSDAVNSAAATAGKHTVVTVNDKDINNETAAKAGTGAFGDYAGADKGNLLIAAKDDNGQMTYNIKLNDQLAIGQKGEPGVAGKDGKDGKVTVETKGGTTVVIGHDGEPGKDGKDGLFVTGKDGADGKSGVSITGPQGTTGTDGIDGKVGIAGKDGNDAVSISGKGGVGHIGLTGPKGADGTPGKDGISIDITTDLKTATLDDGKNVKTVIKDKEGKETTIDQAPRIQYKSGDNTYEVATMDDGLKFVGNDGKEVTKKLNSTLSLTGGITDADALQKASGRNLGVRSNKDGNGLEIVMTDTPDFTKVTVGEGDDTTKKITIGNQTVTGKKSDGTDGTAEKGNYITGLDNTKWNKDNVVENRAATEGQLRDIAGSITNQNQGGGFALASDEKGTDKIVKQDLGKAIQIKGDTTYKADGSVEKAGNIKTSIDNGAIKVELNKDVDLGNGGSVSAGQTKVDQNGVDTNKITIKDSTISISKDGINGGSKQITNVASGASEIIKGEGGKDVYKYDNDTNAANIGDVKRIAGDMKTEINNNISNVTNKVDQIGQHVDNIQKDVTQLKTDVKADRTYQGDDGAAKKVKVKFGSFLSLTGGAKLADLTEEGNIGVVQKEIDDPDHKGEKIAGLSVRLAKHLNLEKTTYTSNENGQTYTSEIDGKGLTIKTGDENRNITVQDGNVNMGGNQIHNVAPGQAPGDAVNVSQLNATNYAVNKLGTRVNRVGAGAAALAALHPLDFDPDDKWDFAAGYGNYRGANAAAVGAYYRPNEDTMFSVGGSFGGGENMVNAGVSIKLGQGNHVSTSRVAMAKEIKDLRQNVANLNAIVNRQSALIDKLTGTNAGMIKDKGNDLFPDVPANHWAYEYVTKLKHAGILTGYPDGNFDGDRMMTRYEFAAIAYRAIMAGAASNPALNQDGTLDKLANEFSSEMKYIRIDTIAKDKNGKPTIERVRVIPDTQHDVQS